MRRNGSSSPRQRVAIVGALIVLGVLVPVGVGYAAPDEDTGVSGQTSRDSGDRDRSGADGRHASERDGAKGGRDGAAGEEASTRDRGDRDKAVGRDGTDADEARDGSKATRSGDRGRAPSRDGADPDKADDRSDDKTPARDGRGDTARTADRDAPHSRDRAEGGDDRPICADGRPDVNPADGICARDAVRTGGAVDRHPQ